MGSLPQLNDDDMQAIGAVFADFLAKSEAQAVLLLAEGGFLVSSYGKTDLLDITSLGALASNSFEANKMMASLMGETKFDSSYQSGEQISMYWQSIDGFNLLVVIFPVAVAVGMIKHYAQIAREQVAGIFSRARQRCPEGLDLVMMNPVDSSQIFKRKEA